jgi:acyl-coenzyme A thioesterase PaaI-like protein
MARPRPEPVQVLKQRRDAALARMAGAVPYIRELGVVFDRRGDELTARLIYAETLVGNPVLPALHGGAIGALLLETGKRPALSV